MGTLPEKKSRLGATNTGTAAEPKLHELHDNFNMVGFENQEEEAAYKEFLALELSQPVLEVSKTLGLSVGIVIGACIAAFDAAQEGATDADIRAVVAAALRPREVNHD